MAAFSFRSHSPQLVASVLELHPSRLQEPPNTAVPLRPRPPSTLQKDPAVGESHGVPGCSFPVASQKIPAPYPDLRGPSSPCQQLPHKEPVAQLVPSLPAGLCPEAPPPSLWVPFCPSQPSPGLTVLEGGPSVALRFREPPLCLQLLTRCQAGRTRSTRLLG